MSLTAAAIRLLAKKGLTVDDIAEIAEANEAEAAVSSAALRTRRWREKRHKASQSVTETKPECVTETVTDRHETSPPRARGLDITSNSELPGELSLALAREWAGESLADMARAPGVASLHSLKSAMKGKNPCSLDDIEAGVRGAAAWYLGKHGPGRMNTWDFAVRLAGEARDRRLAGAPAPAAVVALRPAGTGPPRSFAAQKADEHRQAVEALLAMEANSGQQA